MKKFITIILSLCLLAGFACLASCGGNSEETLTMATNAAFPPYEYKEGDKIVGIDAEIAEKIAEKIGMKLEIVDTEFGSIIGGVQSGKYDIGMAGMTVTEERLESVNFSDTYANAVQVVIVKEDFEYASYEDFYTGYDEEGNPTGVIDGIKIGVQQDTTGDIYASSEPSGWGFGEDNVIRYKTGADAVQALISGKVSCVIIDNEPAKSYVAANKGLTILDTTYVEEEYAIAIAKDNEALLEDINEALDALIKDGTVKKIIDKYIPAE